MKIPVSELIVSYMGTLGIEIIFVMPGAHIRPVYHSLYHSSVTECAGEHEQGAAVDSVFSCTLFNQYGSRVVPNIALQCAHGNLHVFNNVVKPKPDGDEPRLLMICSELGDTGRLLDGYCRCGRLLSAEKRPDRYARRWQDLPGVFRAPARWP